jgi:Secretion system C-terminal sorting domain
MKKIILSISLLFSVLIGFSQVLNAPESVEWDEVNSRWLVGNSGNGTILARSISGALTAFATGMPSGPYGIEILGDKVYACSGGFIRGYNLSNGANVFNLNVGGSFLNGLTSDGVNFLYATDFTAKKIFKIDVAATSFTTIASGLVKTPNGILCEPENNRCLIVNWGSNAPILAINLTTNAITTVLATTLGNCDGITKDSCGNYYITAWSNNKLNKFNPSLTGTFTVIPGTLSSPADIDCRFGDTDTIGIPGGGLLSFPQIVLPNPIITNSNNVLSTTTTFETYQWIFNGQPIIDGNTQTYPVNEIGTYCCQISQGTCEILSNCIEITSLANTNFNNNKTTIKLYPNPSEEKIVLEYPFSHFVKYSIYDASGKIIKKGISEKSNKLEITISNLEAGIYLIKTILDEEIQTNTFLKK